ncbi:U3 small nucleolar ribonucleoprotein IMP3 [Xylariaceae sp. FL1272]|nr:U3 small nucleolar ribonucleoprotein IMP3 [Xylariaceae sp. FL1272]
MVRKLKHHESKLSHNLKKTDLITWKQDNDHRDAAVIRRYMIQDRGDYQKYNKLCGVRLDHPKPSLTKPYILYSHTQQSLRQLAHRLSLLPPESAFRQKHEKLLLEKLHDMGILSSTSKLSNVEHGVTVSAMARRRLPVVLTRLRMAPTVQAATKMIEQGHVRVGTESITDPAFFVTRNQEDLITWTVGSKIKRNIMAYRQKLDDFELL